MRGMQAHIVQRTSPSLCVLKSKAGGSLYRLCSSYRAASSMSSASMTTADSMASTSDADDAGGSKAKVLCLHGFMQTGNVFRMRVGSLRKAMKSRCTFEFMDAPFEASDQLTQEQLQSMGGGAGGLTWFKWKDLGPEGRPSKAVEYADCDKTYAAIKQAVLQARPDGLLGFSQGATAVALFLAQLVTEQAAGRDTDVPLPKFAVMCAGFLPKDPAYAKLLAEARVSMPSLFIIGETDKLIPPERSFSLVETFAAPTTYTHPGAHMVPTCSGAFKAALVEFIEGSMGTSGPGE